MHLVAEFLRAVPGGSLARFDFAEFSGKIYWLAASGSEPVSVICWPSANRCSIMPITELTSRNARECARPRMPVKSKTKTPSRRKSVLYGS